MNDIENLNDVVPRWATQVATLTAVAGALLLAIFLITWLVRRSRAERAATPGSPGVNWKLKIGFVLVQGGLSFIVVTGVYEFFHTRLKMPQVEAGILSIFMEATVWTAVGFVMENGRASLEVMRDGAVVVKEDGTAETRPTTGWGMAGPFFWLCSGASGVLAILGSTSGVLALGRTVIVAVGTAMWVLRLMSSTRRGRRSRFRYTPLRIAEAKGWVEPVPDQQEGDQNLEWKIRGLVAAIRKTNSLRPRTAAAGRRKLMSLAASTTPDVLRVAQVRYAAAALMAEQSADTSEVMKAVRAAITMSTVTLAQLGEQRAVDDARDAADSAARRRPDPRRTSDIGPDTDTGSVSASVGDQPAPTAAAGSQNEDGIVQPIAGQLDKDRAAAAAIYRLVVRLTGGRQYATWDEVRDAIRGESLLNKIERASKDTELPMGKPRINRILGRAETYFPVPPAEELAEEARSA